MAISVVCNVCKHAYKVDETLVGKRVKCKHCGTGLLIEAPPPPDLDPFAEGAFDESPTEEPAGKKPVKLYNPIDSNSISSPSAKTPLASSTPSAGQFVGAARGARSTRLPIKLFIWVALALLLLVSLGVAGYYSAEVYSQVKDGKVALNTVLKIWGWVISFDVLLFIVLGPLLLLGVWGAAKVVHARLDGSAYFRACAVVAVAAILACIARMSPDLLKITLFVLLLPAVYGVVKVFFNFDWGESGVATAFGAGALLLGGIIVKVILGLIMDGTVFSAVDSARQIASAIPAEKHSDDSSSWDATPTPGDSTPPLPASRDPAAYEKFKELVQATTSADISKFTREERMPDVLFLRRRADSLRAAFQKAEDWPETIHRIDVFEQAVAALPSGKIDNAIYTDAPDADEWTTGLLSRGKMGPEISFLRFKLQVPDDMKLDLRCSESSPEGLIWTAASGASLSISARPRMNARQVKPVVTDKPAVIRVAEAQGVFAVNGANMTSAEGQVNGVLATRLTENNGEHVSQYYLGVGNQWIVIQVHPSGDRQYGKVVNAAARTVREIEPGEKRSDPLAPDFVALRLMDEYERAAAVLRSEGAAGEDAVDKLLANTDPAVIQTAMKYLTENGTIRSVQALRVAMGSSDPGTAEMAKTAITHLRAHQPTTQSTQPASPAQSVQPPAIVTFPAAPGDMRFIMSILHRKDAVSKQSVVRKLATTSAEEKYRHDISTRLAEMLRSGDNDVPTADLVTALSVWGDATIGLELGPLLKEGGDAGLRHAAMKILGALKDASSAPAIVKWLKLDSATTVEALIAIGPAAESAVAPSLKDSDAIVRIDAARILERIGTRKSLLDLTRAAHDAKDPAASQSAQMAIDSIKSRTPDDSPP